MNPFKEGCEMLYLKGTKIQKAPNEEDVYIRCVLAIETLDNNELFSISGDDILLNDRHIFSFHEDTIYLHNLHDGLRVNSIINNNLAILRNKGLFYDRGVSNDGSFLYQVSSIQRHMRIDIVEIYGPGINTTFLEKRVSFIATKDNFHNRLFFRSQEGICFVDLNMNNIKITYLPLFPYSLVSNSVNRDNI
jgi:hypothetical protein